MLNAATAIAGPREANKIRVLVRGVDAMVQIEVGDSGSGIDPEVLPHIFDPFFTTH